MAAYYNENDPKAAEWLRSLIREGLITDGEVDERSIKDVQGSDLRGFDRVHLFAGIGGWDYALRLSGWPVDAPVWTGSCPCQPFSAAGKRKGTKDDRHLWPEMFRLIAECQPPTVFGEQVASKAGREWLAGVFADLENVGYAVAGADLCAAGVGAPHIRQRLWWVADAASWEQRWPRQSAEGDGPSQLQTGGYGSNGRVANSECDRQHGSGNARTERRAESANCGSNSGLEHTKSDGRQQGRAESERRSIASGCGNGGLGDPDGQRFSGNPERDQQTQAEQQAPCGADTLRSDAWCDFRLIECRDGKTRRIESSTEPLAHGIPGRVAQLRGLGNAIVPQVAAEFIGAFLDARVCECP